MPLEKKPKVLSYRIYSQSSQQCKYQDLAFDTIRIYTYLKPQNDCLDLNLVKDIYAVGTKITENGQKMAINKFSESFSSKIEKNKKQQ